MAGPGYRRAKIWTSIDGDSGILTCQLKVPPISLAVTSKYKSERCFISQLTVKVWTNFQLQFNSIQAGTRDLLSQLAELLDV